MTSSNRELSLRNFFIFNVSFGQKEGEEDQKIMYYFPRDTDLDTQIRDIGLSEAIIKFSRTFSEDKCEALQTQKMRRLFYQPEDNFLVVLTVNVPTAPKGKDGLEGIEYLGHEVQNIVFSAVLRQAYTTAKLFLGPFQSILNSQNNDPALLKKKLDNFYSRYIPSLRLEKCDILDIFQGVGFLPLDKVTFLHFECFVNRVEAALSIVDFSVLLFNDQLVWSGLPPEDLQVVFRYIKTSLLPSFRDSCRDTMYQDPDSGRFIIGPSQLECVKFVGKPPKRVHLSRVKEPGFYQMVAYQFLRATLFLFVKSSEELTMDFYRLVNKLCSERLTELCGEVRKHSSRDGAGRSASGSNEAAGGDDSQWVYFNSMNLATKSTLHKPRVDVPITKEVLRILVDIHSHHLRLSSLGCHSGETFIRTMSSRWIVGKMSNCREFYVTINRKKNNLIEVNEEVKKICDKQLKGIFFHV